MKKFDGEWFLKEIGADLDLGRQLKVLAEGVLWPSTASAASIQVLGPPEYDDVAARKAANRTEGEGEGERREGQEPKPEGRSRRTWPSSSASPEFRKSQLAGIASDHHTKDLASALAAYPQFKVRLAPPGVWLSGRIQPIPSLPDGASIVMVYPFEPSYTIRGWAWWDCGIWVGPRHTNYGDGSICAFEPTDRTGVWRAGDPLLQLLDYWASWLGRHIYLTRMGRWPGPQSLHTAFERLNEHRPGEMCGCGSSVRYEQCCRIKDTALSATVRKEEFRKVFPWPFRHPPITYQDCMRLAMQPPVSAEQIRARHQLRRMLRTPYSVQ
jgi:hypothetical protein